MRSPFEAFVSMRVIADTCSPYAQARMDQKGVNLEKVRAPEVDIC
jgi:hypothetical protein